MAIGLLGILFISSPLPDSTHASVNLGISSVRPALFSSRPIKPRFSVAHASASLRHRLSLGNSRNMPSGTPLMLRSLRHLPPLPHDCPAEIAAAISRAARREHKTKKSIHGEFTLHRQSFGLAQGLRFIEPLATPTSSHFRSSATYPPESPYSSYSSQAVSRVPDSAKRPLSVPE